MSVRKQNSKPERQNTCIAQVVISHIQKILLT